MIGNKMKIKNYANKGFSKLSVLLFITALAVTLIFVSCSGSDEKSNPVENKDSLKSAKDISDTSMKFSGMISDTTCLDCHPEMKDGGFDIDFSKVKEAGMIIDKGQDVLKEDKKESDK